MAPTLRLLLAVALALCALAVNAAAQSAAKPVPGCQGVQIADPAGDATSAAADVTDVFFLTVGSKTTVNITVKDLASPGGDAIGPQIRWYAAWTLGEAVKFVRAASDGTFAYGTLADSSYSTEGNTTGKFHPGADGVIEIVVPTGSAPKLKKLESPAVEVKNAIAHPAGAAFAPGADPDRAPDAEGGKAYTVQPCEAAAAPAPPPPPPPAATSEQQVARGALAVRAPAKVRAPRTKTLAIRLSSSGKVTDLEARLSKGAAQLGTGRVASLDRKGTVKVKLSRKARKGSYTLYLVGTNPDGTRADKTLKLKLR